MKDMGDIDNLIDNFDVHAVWDKQEVVKIVAVYSLAYLVLGTFMARSLIKASTPGAAPKGMNLSGIQSKIIR